MAGERGARVVERVDLGTLRVEQRYAIGAVIRTGRNAAELRVRSMDFAQADGDVRVVKNATLILERP